MEAFTLTRKEMATLLLALDGRHSLTPLQVLQEAWKKAHRDALEAGKSLPVFLTTELPPIIERMIKGGGVKGFSLQEIATLGKLIEYSHLSITSMQNWVKRDFKPYFECPKMGRKYSLNQAALLFIIDDLKSNLDFASILQLFELLFNKPQTDEDDVIGPLDLYVSYSGMFEELDANNDQLMDTDGHVKESRNQDALTEIAVRSAADRYAKRLPHLTKHQSEALRNVLFIAAISIQTSYFHSLARRYLNATLFLTDSMNDR
ncbi:DUF1836 domain-containing protein [Paenibacillus allorhizosphaerae]|uniref:DUF1836 domain-containing protein n=1 Tax=Paenibacillus allorhizosphaerae TaxID=2849866 RepID=A0ABN7TL91_9BACL|nr:DUF1836 domain-containing protein [Paenibacillus allorhizosphaerae]CAG7635310.1 hypothetical protein PAECIP111802_02125 [Paenibacillus allorhizosphaerae]